MNYQEIARLQYLSLTSVVEEMDEETVERITECINELIFITNRFEGIGLIALTLLTLGLNSGEIANVGE